jgi:hypothetical protein
MNKKALSKFTEPKIAGLLMSVCVADAVYMLSLYQVTYIMDCYVCNTHMFACVYSVHMLSLHQITSLMSMHSSTHVNGLVYIYIMDI